MNKMEDIIQDKNVCTWEKSEFNDKFYKPVFLVMECLV